MRDPNPQSGGPRHGRNWSRPVSACARACLAAQAAALNPGFVKRMTKGLPYLRLKLALSLDGRTALANGASRWISGPQSRRDVHKLRAASAAILSSAATVIRDDPRLNAREIPFEHKPPLRVILDRALKCPPAARLFARTGPRCDLYAE